MQTTDEILNKSTWFKQMQARLKQQRLLQERFSILVGPPYQDKCQVSRFQDGILYLVTSAAWASKIYYESARLLALLKTDVAFKGIEGIRCFVAPIETHSRAEAPSPALSKQEKMTMNLVAAESLFHCAESVSDPELKKALKRLAGHAI